MDKEIKLSEKEQKLLDFITSATDNVTAKLIEEQLGKEYLGAIGRLIQQELIVSKKKRVPAPSNIYGTKGIKVYTIVTEKEQE